MKSPVILSALLLLGWAPHPVPPLEDFPMKDAFIQVVDFGISKRLMLTEAQVDGKKGLFLFDTGASHLTLNQRHFPEKKIIENIGQTSNILQSETATNATKVAQFSWGGISRSSLLCPVTDLSDLEKHLGYPILGLIGYEIIRDYEVEVDYVNQLIILASGDKRSAFQDDPPTYSLDFSLCGHMPVIEASVGTNRSIYLGLDSGASVNVLDKSWKPHVEDVALRKDKIRFTGAAAGVKEADYMMFREITLDNQVKLNPVGLVLTDFNVPTGRCFRVDGLIGIDAFSCKRVVIDYRNFKLHVWLGEGTSFADGCF